MKWIDRIKSGDYQYGRGQLRFDDYFDPWGVLCDFLDPDAWTPRYSLPIIGIEDRSWIEDHVQLSGVEHFKWHRPPFYSISYEWNGETFKLPESARKKCKIKSEYGDLETGNGVTINITDMFDAAPGWTNIVHYIEEYYEQI